MQTLLPLSFDPIYKEKIWGGQKLREVLGKEVGELPNCGESWELSGVPGNISVVREGSCKGRTLTSLIDQFEGVLLGNRVFEKFGNRFPLLIKFIDAQADLSVQVHPDDALAMERHGSFGKTEMWYIMAADPGATLISGFNQQLTKETYRHALETGKIMEVLNREEVEAGDVYYLPAGRVHTIGKGLLLAEIQQTSDVTYRIYDFDRRDDQGNTRELHTDLAVDAIDFRLHDSYKTPYDQNAETASLVQSPYFETSLHHCTTRKILDTSADSFHVLIGVEGAGMIRVDQSTFSLKMGGTLLVPGHINEVEMDGNFKFLRTFVPA